jgi:hypothetical protein
MASSRVIVAMIALLGALLFPAALSMPDQLISMTTDGQFHSMSSPPPVLSIADDLDPDYYNVSCPGVRDMVRSAVQKAVEQEFTIATNLLRMFFHDCFPQVSVLAANFVKSTSDRYSIFITVLVIPRTNCVFCVTKTHVYVTYTGMRCVDTYFGNTTQ